MQGQGLFSERISYSGPAERHEYTERRKGWSVQSDKQEHPAVFHMTSGWRLSLVTHFVIFGAISRAACLQLDQYTT